VRNPAANTKRLDATLEPNMPVVAARATCGGTLRWENIQVVSCECFADVLLPKVPTNLGLYRLARVKLLFGNVL
jgi:hypothetical protein